MTPQWLNEIPGRTALIKGKFSLFFTGFSYYGMNELPEFKEILHEGIDRYGPVFPSSRLSNSRNPLFKDFEEKLSTYLGVPASACMSSGYMASKAAVRYAASKGKVFYLSYHHPSLQVSDTGSHKNRIGTQEEIIEWVNHSQSFCSIALVSINTSRGEVCNLDWLKEIRRKVLVVVDDSHGIGILGKNGEGTISLLPQSENIEYLFCYSLSKAFHCEGGAVSGDQPTIEEIKSNPPFSASTPMSPLMVYAWLKSGELFKKQLNRLKENSQYLAEQLKGIETFSYDPRLPILYLPLDDLYQHALQNQILLSAFHYPSKTGTLVTRAIINALHTKEDIDQLVKLLKEEVRI